MYQNAIAAATIKLAGTSLKIEEGEEILVTEATNQPANFTKYFALKASDPDAGSILIEREDFRFVTDGIVWNQREREDREAARLYRAHCVWNGGETRTTAAYADAQWPRRLWTRFLLSAVARHAAEYPDVQFRSANVASFVDWEYRRVQVEVHNGFGGLTHWDCSLRNLTEVA